MAITPQIGYEQDFYAWTFHNASLLREGKFSEIDIENIAEELESMGRRDKRVLESRLSVLLMHLLKWQFQPMRRSNSWKLTIKKQRLSILRLLKESPRLKYNIAEVLEEAYEDGWFLT